MDYVDKPYRFYVAAPYCPRDCELHSAAQIAQRNVDSAIEMGNALIDRGHYAFVPHLSHYLHIHYSCKKDRGVWYYEFDNTFLDLWTNAFYYGAASCGADAELNRAHKNGYPIFWKMEDVPWVKP